MNKKETKKISNELKKIGITITNESGNILFFGSLPYHGKRVFRDENKNLIKIDSDHYLVYYEAGINKNGVGDGKSPAVALTYSIGFYLSAERRDYRHKYYYPIEFNKFYGYSRELPELISRLKEHLRAINS